MNLLIYIEEQKGGLSTHSLQAFAFARSIESNDDKNRIMVAGIMPSERVVDELSTLGVSIVYTLPEMEITDRRLVSALQTAMKQADAQLFIFPHNIVGADVAPQVAASEEIPIVSKGIKPPIWNGKEFIAERLIFSGKAEQKLQLHGARALITIPQHLFPSATPMGERTSVEVIPVDVPDLENVLRSLSKNELMTDRPPLSDARVIVSGGMGMQGVENWTLLEHLAHKLGAALACTRLVSDSGWRPHHEHVGQTGITVSPELYIAVGISGAIQHLAGMNQSTYIVAINKDKEAPIFQVADYGIIGDAMEILPKLIQLLS